MHGRGSVGIGPIPVWDLFEYGCEYLIPESDGRRPNRIFSHSNIMESTTQLLLLFTPFKTV